MNALHDVDLYASAIFDLCDRFLMERGVSGYRPRPLGQVRFRLTHRMDASGELHPLLKPPDLHMTTNYTGFQLFFRTIEDGDGIRYRLAPGSYRVRIDSEFYQPMTDIPLTAFPLQTATCGREGIATKAQPIDLSPALNYPFPARTTRLYGAFPLACAGVTVRAFDPQTNTALSEATLTNTRGDWLLIFMKPLPVNENNAVEIVVRFSLPDGQVIASKPFPIDRYTENSFPQNTLQGA